MDFSHKSALAGRLLVRMLLKNTVYARCYHVTKWNWFNQSKAISGLVAYYIALWHEQSFLKNRVYVQFSLGRMSSTHAMLSTPVLRSEKFA